MADQPLVDDPNESEVQPLASELQRGPAFLLLGQRYYSEAGEEDSFLAAIADRSDQQDAYRALKENRLGSLTPELQNWLAERARMAGIAEWLRNVSEFPWSAVYSSSIDSNWERAFRNEWRETEPVLNEDFSPPDPRHRTRLHCTYLFGLITRGEANETVPTSPFQFVRRSGIASRLLYRIVEDLTPLGRILIAGYDPAQDWLRTEALFDAASRLGQRQVHLFTGLAAATSDPFIQELEHLGVLVLHRMSLATWFARATSSIRLGPPPDQVEAQRLIQIGDNIASIPKDIWVRTTSIASIVSEAALVEPSDLGRDASYRRWRNFLGSTSGPPRWEDLARGLAFRRGHARQLDRVVRDALTTPEGSDQPIILHGQTGTGKTVSLGLLALDTARERIWPVLHIAQGTRDVRADEIDRFAFWAESVGAPRVLVVYDGMLESVERYGELLRAVSSRGRKVVLVGSTYRIDPLKRRSRYFVNATASFSDAEVGEFRQYLAKFDPQLAAEVNNEQKEFLGEFLVALYRLLPTSRAQLREGVVAEMAHSEHMMSRRASEAGKRDRAPEGAMAFALWKAGLLDGPPLDLTTESSVAGELATNAQHLTALIMVPGQLGLSVPMELAVRALEISDYTDLHPILQQQDMIRWVEDGEGNLSLAPRNSLEARLIVQSRLAGTQSEVLFMRRLLEATSDDGTWTGGREVGFAVDLVRTAAGQRSPHKGRYEPYFGQLGDSLTALRERRVQNPRLMLQEANLKREWAIDQTKVGADREVVMGSLTEAIEVADQALELLPDDRGATSMRGNLIVERATALAALAQEAGGQDRAEAVSLYADTRRALLGVRGRDPSNYHSASVLLWSTRNAIQQGIVTGPDQAEAVADVLSGIEGLVVADLDPQSAESLEDQKRSFYEAIGEHKLADEAFNRLLEMGSSAGIFWRAWERARLDLVDEEASRADRSRLAEALDYLTSMEESVELDVRCRNLFFDLWWLVHTGFRPCVRERLAVGLTYEQWMCAKRLIRKVHDAGESYRGIVLRFLDAVATFHLGDYGLALQEFKDLERDSDIIRSRRRVILSYLVSDESGQPVEYRGTVNWVSGNGNSGDAYVDELGLRIAFLPYEFGVSPNDRHRAIGPFYIGFNFRGALCDPIGYRRNMSRRESQ